MESPNPQLSLELILYVKMGWRLIPLHSVRPDGRCTCGDSNCEKNAGKHPRISAWQKNASADLEQVTRWATQFPGCNWGLACGEESNVLALDIDMPFGLDSLKELESALREELPETVINLTGSGGQHWLYHYPKGRHIANAVKLKGLFDGIDVRSNNGYIVLPPSIHKSGRNYEWDLEHHPEDMELVKLPESLIHYLESDPALQFAQVSSEPWEPLPIEVAARLPEVCERLGKSVANADGAAQVKYPEWIGFASWARAAAADVSLFDEWSRPYPKYNAREVQKKWRDTEDQVVPYTCQTMQTHRPLPECETCPIFQSTYRNPVALLRAEYGKELGLNRPYGAPSYVDAILQGVKTEGTAWLKDHEDIVDKARRFEPDEFRLWTEGEGVAVALDTAELEVDEDYLDSLGSKPSSESQEPRLKKVVDNSEKLKSTEEQIMQFIEKMKTGEPPVQTADKAVPLLCTLALANERTAKMYARTLARADKSKTITEKIVWDSVKESVSAEKEKQQQEQRKQARERRKEKNAYNPLKTGFRRNMAVQWAEANEERFVLEGPRGSLYHVQFNMAKALVEDFNMQFAFDGIYAFNGRHYEEVEKQVKGFIQEANHTIMSIWGDAALAESTMKSLIVYLESLSDNNTESWYNIWDAQPYIVFQNGVLDMTDPSWPHLVPFDPKYQCTWAINCNWDPGAKSEAVDRYLETTLPDLVTRQSILEYLGYSLARFDQSQQRYALLYGGGRNGKGLFINVLSSLFAKSYASCSLKDLAENRFSAYQLLNAAVNLVGDMSGEHLESTELLKQITGNDPISAEQKFKSQFKFKPRTKMIFALNELPSTSDPSHGFFRRPLVYPFRQRFEGANQDPQLAQLIQTPEALSYWAWIALSKYGEMMARDSRIIESDEMKKTLNDYRKANDIVAMAVEDGIIEFGEDFTIPRDLLHLAFQTYAESLGRKTPASNKLIERIRNAQGAGAIKERRIGTRGGRSMVWSGLRLGEGGKELRIERQYIENETHRVVKASTSIEEYYNMGKQLF